MSDSFVIYPPPPPQQVFSSDIHIKEYSLEAGDRWTLKDRVYVLYYSSVAEFCCRAGFCFGFFQSVFPSEGFLPLVFPLRVVGQHPFEFVVCYVPPAQRSVCVFWC